MTAAVSHEIPVFASAAPQTAPGPVKAKPRVVFLDVIRGLAALLVLIEHTNEVVDKRFLFWSFRWMNFGRVGVAAFFLVSGFVIPYSLERANSLKHFWISRFFRLYPLYWASLILVTLMYFAGVYPMPYHWAKAFAFNLTMFQEFFDQPHLMGLYWTLTLEMIFYVTFSLLFVMGMNKKSLLWAWLGLGMLLLISYADRNGIEPGVHHKLPVARFALLVFALIGTVVFRYFSGFVTGRQLGTLVAAATIILAVSMRLGFRNPMDVSDAQEEWSWFSMFSSYAAAGVLFALVYMFRSAEFPKALQWLGAISYSVYLLHYPTWLMLWKIPHNGYPQGLLWIAATLVGTIAISSLSYLYIEKPAIAFGKKFLQPSRVGASVTHVAA